MGVTLETFQAEGTFCWRRERLKILVKDGKILTAVFRSICPETPSGPVAVLVF